MSDFITKIVSAAAGFYRVNGYMVDGEPLWNVQPVVAWRVRWSDDADPAGSEGVNAFDWFA